MKQVKYFDVYSKGKITKYCVDDTENYRNMVRLIKSSDKDSVVAYIEFDDGTNGFTNEFCNLINIVQQPQIKSLQDFRKLSTLDKYKECVHYGNHIAFTDMNTMDGILTFEAFEIYSAKYIFILLAGKAINCYELQ